MQLQVLVDGAVLRQHPGQRDCLDALYQAIICRGGQHPAGRQPGLSTPANAIAMLIAGVLGRLRQQPAALLMSCRSQACL